MRKASFWTEEYTEAESLDMLRELARTCVEGVNHPVADVFVEAIKRNDFKTLLTTKLETAEVVSTVGITGLHALVQAKALFSAYEELVVPGVDPEMACLLDLLDTEAHCRETNELFRAVARGAAAFPPWFEGVLYRAQRWVARIVGPVPSLGDLGLRFGPGATTRTKKRMASVKRKLGDGVSCSDELLGWAKALLSEMPSFATLNADASCDDGEGTTAVVSIHLEIAAMTLINKKWNRKRTTETQPVLNGMLQLGIGDYLKDHRCARFYGLDLSNQELNRSLARIGSLTGVVATLDQSSASNLVAFEAARALFPVDWFELLRVARTGTTHVPYIGPMKLEMLAGMGNGFTFPVQSIIFYALAQAVAEEFGSGNTPIISVYGDDVIIDTELVAPYVETLRLFGLRVNADKSFWDGDFRESCGADFFLGTDVRPVFCKERLTPARLFSLHNGFVRRGFPELAEKVRHWLHPSLVLWGPDGYGDGHLIREDWRTVARRHKLRDHGFGGYVFDTFAKSAKRHWDWHPGDAILPQYTAYRRGESPVVDLSGVGSKEPSTQVQLFLAKWERGIATPTEGTVIPFADHPPVKEDGSPAFTPWGPKVVSPEGLLEEGWAKACTFPGEEGYRRISVYVLG